MKNPYNDFRPGSYQIEKRPVQRIVEEKQDVFNHIIKGYLDLVENEIKDLAWVV